MKRAVQWDQYTLVNVNPLRNEFQHIAMYWQWSSGTPFHSFVDTLSIRPLRDESMVESVPQEINQLMYSPVHALRFGIAD